VQRQQRQLPQLRLRRQLLRLHLLQLRAAVVAALEAAAAVVVALEVVVARAVAVVVAAAAETVDAAAAIAVAVKKITGPNLSRRLSTSTACRRLSRAAGVSRSRRSWSLAMELARLALVWAAQTKSPRRFARAA